MMGPHVSVEVPIRRTPAVMFVGAVIAFPRARVVLHMPPVPPQSVYYCPDAIT